VLAACLCSLAAAPPPHRRKTPCCCPSLCLQPPPYTADRKTRQPGNETTPHLPPSNWLDGHGRHLCRIEQVVWCVLCIARLAWFSVGLIRLGLSDWAFNVANGCNGRYLNVYFYNHFRVVRNGRYYCSFSILTSCILTYHCRRDILEHIVIVCFVLVHLTT
jgi:hypothetical protein